ncbi:hypothetical protein AsAng_0050700 [Aureispira anguillae]|uniref:Uncharacterized protein n=1 Tax=Aureispira anguillae TaxID=2864201 RepID=A0A916DWS0_9BACT|nr:hypothetical protein AsAng_0050700 [Aureispira anguillae]
MYTEALVQSNKISNHQKAKKILTDHLQTNPNEIQIQKALTSIIQ